MKKDNRLTNSFLKQIYDCKDITLLFGLGKILKVPPLNQTVPTGIEAPLTKPFEQYVVDLINAFDKQSRGRRREIVKIFKAANAEVRAHGHYDIDAYTAIKLEKDAAEPQGDDERGTRTQNSQEENTDEAMSEM